MSEIGKPITRIKAVNSSAKAAVLADDKFRGLPKNLFLCEGARVVLTTNLWKEAGLVNGASGTVRDIVYKDGERVFNEEAGCYAAQPGCIVVEMDDYNGPPFFDDPARSKYVPFTPTSFDSDSIGGGTRTQYPLRLAYAMTIHKDRLCQRPWSTLAQKKLHWV